MTRRGQLGVVTGELDAAGVPYRVLQGGKHLKVKFGQRLEHLLVISRTPSDRRADRNARAGGRRALRGQAI